MYIITNDVIVRISRNWKVWKQETIAIVMYKIYERNILDMVQLTSKFIHMYMILVCFFTVISYV